MSQGEYTLGVSQEEATRLKTQHEVFADKTRELWNRAGLAPGARVIDLGCGPGFGTVDLARAVGPEGKVFAVDRSARYLEMVRAQAERHSLHNIEAIEADAQAIGSLEAIAHGSIDLCYARYLLCYPPRPGAVVSGVARKLKRAGRFVVEDFCNYAHAPVLSPRSEAFDTVTRAVAAAIADDGGDPDIATRLPELLAIAGFSIEHMDSVQRLARPGTQLWTYRDLFYRNMVPRLLERGRLSQTVHDRFMADWQAATANPLAFALAPTVVAIVAFKV